RRRERKARRDGVEARELAEHLVQLRERLELVRIEAALAREAGGIEQRREMARPFGGARLRRPLLAEELLEQRAQQRRALYLRDEGAERDARAELAAQPRVELRALAELALGAADERRAQDGARLLERYFPAR